MPDEKTEDQYHKILCEACGCLGYPKLAKKVLTGGFHYHVGAYCRQCNSWIKWLRQDSSVLTELRKQEEDSR